jgi:hypothetical protein
LFSWQANVNPSIFVTVACNMNMLYGFQMNAPRATFNMTRDISGTYTITIPASEGCHMGGTITTPGTTFYVWPGPPQSSRILLTLDSAANGNWFVLQTTGWSGGKNMVVSWSANRPVQNSNPTGNIYGQANNQFAFLVPTLSASSTDALDSSSASA